MGVFRNEWDREISKKMPSAFKEQWDEVLRSLKFKCQSMYKDYRRWIQRFISNPKRVFHSTRGM